MSVGVGRDVAALIWCPFPDQDSASAAANTLLDERLVACANMIPGMVSLFEWNGERDEARETGVVLKTNAVKLDRAIARLAELHPYEEPAIVGWRCDAAAPGTVAWLGALGE
ncbi:MAG: divalent-cation tolerance protein CutA [Novosphingobium sp.]|nr:divalent-cation tolerance protein CutA [Novosphingobium sp.]MCP5402004.1 divalent-cation tolerance protein CutA [Novosphingobium sp.]